MLKSIKIRGKLLLLLTVPLIAVLVFAASGVIDRTEIVDEKERDARLADAADAGADLSVALQVERFESIQAARFTSDTAEQRPDQVATDLALQRWSASVRGVLPDITDPALAEDFAAVRALMQESLTDSRFDRPSNVVGDQLNTLTGKLTAINVALSTQATEIGRAHV